VRCTAPSGDAIRTWGRCSRNGDCRRIKNDDGSRGAIVRKGLSADPLTLTSPRHGHFRLESGHHSNLWLDLEGLFVRPAPVRPFVTRLARALRPHRVAGVCGPLVGGAFLAQMVATALKAEFFFTERVMPGEGDGLYQAQYHLPRAARSQVRDKRLAIVDDAMRGVPVEAVSRVPFDLWVPAECPLCASGKALADP
jgi:orotate phosphoribosyltransferase